MPNKTILNYYYCYFWKMDLYQKALLYSLSFEKACITYCKPINEEKDN